jgi:hypothetical protein
MSNKKVYKSYVCQVMPMKIILFDLSDTLEYKVQNKDVLMPGALDLLSAVKDLHDHSGESPVPALVSDFNESAENYYAILRDLKIDEFFIPLKERVTLSNEIGVFKPNEKIFRTAIDKISKDLQYSEVFFITENKEHIIAARKLGMMTIRLAISGNHDHVLSSAEFADMVKRGVACIIPEYYFTLHNKVSEYFNTSSTC